MSLRTLAVIEAGLATMLSGLAHGQDSLIVRNPTVCATCQIEATRRITLSARAGFPAFNSPSVIARDRRGRFYLADARGLPTVFVYDSLGRLFRTLNLPQQSAIGPTWIRALAIGRGDTLHAYGAAEAVFDSTGRFVRSATPLQGAPVNQAVSIADGRFVLQGIIGTPDLFGLPFHVIDANGIRKRSFGSDPKADIDGNPFARVGSVSLAADETTFWSGFRNRYRMEQWSLHGTMIRAINRDANWFHPWLTWNSRYDVNPPPPRLMSVREDSAGRLWTVSLVAARAWKRVPGRSADEEVPMPTVKEIAEANESIIEVIDPKAGRLLASQRFAHAFTILLGGDLVAELTTNGRNEPMVAVWKLALHPAR